VSVGEDDGNVVGGAAGDAEGDVDGAVDGANVVKRVTFNGVKIQQSPYSS
jgi:hypothetical protein